MSLRLPIEWAEPFTRTVGPSIGPMQRISQDPVPRESCAWMYGRRLGIGTIHRVPRRGWPDVSGIDGASSPARSFASRREHDDHEGSGYVLRGRLERPRRRPAHDLHVRRLRLRGRRGPGRSEEHTSELQSQSNLVCRLLLEKKKKNINGHFCIRKKNVKKV